MGFSSNICILVWGSVSVRDSCWCCFSSCCNCWSRYCCMCISCLLCYCCCRWIFIIFCMNFFLIFELFGDEVRFCLILVRFERRSLSSSFGRFVDDYGVVWGERLLNLLLGWVIFDFFGFWDFFEKLWEVCKFCEGGIKILGVCVEE